MKRVTGIGGIFFKSEDPDKLYQWYETHLGIRRSPDGTGAAFEWREVTHSTLRVTPAMEAGLTDHVWSLEEMCATLPAQASAAKRIDKGLILKALGEEAS
jgi:hypothetical protein